MPFNEVMGVGSIPQVTQDSTIPPLGIYDDITNLAFGQVTAPAGTTISGSVINVINPNFDYINNAGLGATASAGVARDYLTVIWDIGRTLAIRGLTIFFSLQGAADNTFTVQISNDNVTYTTVFTQLLNSGTETYYTAAIGLNQFRYIKMVSNTNGAAQVITNIRNMTVKMGNVQRFY